MLMYLGNGFVTVGNKAESRYPHVFKLERSVRIHQLPVWLQGWHFVPCVLHGGQEHSQRDLFVSTFDT